MRLRFTFLTALLTLTTLMVNGQTMSFFFKQIPAEWTPELSSKQKDTLLQKGNYIIPGGDSLNTTKYVVDITTTDYLSSEYSFTTGQKAFIHFELRRFTNTNGRQFIVYSTCSGMRKAYSQADLMIFDIENGILKQNIHQKLLPETIAITDFVKKETPDSIKVKIEKAVNDCYDLYPASKNEITFRIHLNWSEDFEQWLIGNTLSFTWNGHSFDKKIKNEE